MSETPERSNPGKKTTDRVGSRKLSRRQAIAAAGAVLGTLTVSPAKAEPGSVPIRRKPGDSSIKQQTREDYRNSLADYGGWMSNPIKQLMGPAERRGPTDMDVAIIGSGYGGAICAARLGQQRQPNTRICLFERGREWRPGDYPDTLGAAIQANRLSLRSATRNAVTQPTELFNYSQSNEFDIITASALGGTSLINANVAIQPDREVFQQSRWPKDLRHREILDPFYHAAAVEMGVAPGVLDSTPKMVAQRRAAARLATHDKNFYAANLTVTFDGRFLDQYGRNRQGMLQRPCTACGDCLSGCNVGAKNTIQMNYMPLAKRNGVEIYTQTEVRSIEKKDGFYQLNLVFHQGHGEKVVSTPFSKTARIVVVSGGSLGSTAIMLRSQEKGLKLSDSLGQKWSGNGDVLGFMTNTRDLSNSGGFGAFPGGQNPVGPSIQTITEMYRSGPLDQRFLFQDGSMPRAYAGVIGSLMGDLDLDRLMVIFGMGHDGSQGKVVMKNDIPVVEWPGAKESKYRLRMRAELDKLAQAHGGKYEFLTMFGSNLITVHPLGGCNMSDDPMHGVVNDVGQVFDGATGGGTDPAGDPKVHAGLYVADGSIVPGSLGANPFFTISALSERIAASIAMDARHRDLFRGA